MTTIDYGLSKDLVGHWTMSSSDINSGTLYDSTAGDLPDATINGVSTGLAGSPLGEYTESDGSSSSYIGTRYQLSSTLQNGFSSSFWVKDIGAAGVSNGRFLSMDISDWWGAWRNGSVGTISLDARDGSGSGYSIEDNNLGTGVWAHYVLVWDHTVPEFRAYKNGSLFGTRSVSNSGFGTGSVTRYLILHDGSESNSYNTNQNIPTDCGLSDIRVWERPITESEVNILYQMGEQRHYNI